MRSAGDLCALLLTRSGDRDRRNEPEHIDGRRKPLQLDLAEGFEVEVRPGAGPFDIAAHENLVRPGVTLNPRCDVHGPDEEVAVAGDDVARVDPRASGRHSRFVGQLNDVGARLDCVGGVIEMEHRAVPDELDDRPWFAVAARWARSPSAIARRAASRSPACSVKPVYPERSTNAIAGGAAPLTGVNPA